MEIPFIIKKQSEQFIFLGVLLFFLGLIVGLLVPVLANPRMGLSSHIEGVMNGMLLVIIGLIWKRVKLPPRWLKVTFWMAIYGTFVNWFGILIAAIFNAGKNLTIAAQGRQGHPIAEGIVNFALVSLTLAMLFVSIAILIGLTKNRKSESGKD
jgi:hydroxylaminobenzene mutase